jgi:hypothetical protein
VPLYDNVEKRGTVIQATDNITRRMRFAYWITKTIDTHTHTHSEFAIHTAFPRQQRLRERDSMLRYTYLACLVFACCWDSAFDSSIRWQGCLPAVRIVLQHEYCPGAVNVYASIPVFTSHQKMLVSCHARHVTVTVSLNGRYC